MSINRPERKKSAAKAAAILEGARQEFLVHGYASTSMDRVASAAGVSKATVYSHFQDKAGLFSAVVEQLAEDRFQPMLFDLHDESTLKGDPRTVLTGLAQKFLDEAACDSQFCEFMRLIVGESGRFPELSAPYVENVAKPLVDVITRYLDGCEALDLNDPEAIARTFVGTLVYFIILQRVLGGSSLMPMEGDRMISTLVDLIAPSAQNTD
ncbi:MAG: TetR/AcrR family transcriptional regulator [Phormidesmis sp.]